MPVSTIQMHFGMIMMDEYEQDELRTRQDDVILLTDACMG
jgi:hypothetical protein